MFGSGDKKTMIDDKEWFIEDLESPRVTVHFDEAKPSVREYNSSSFQARTRILAVPGQRDPLDGIFDATRGSILTGVSLESKSNASANPSEDYTDHGRSDDSVLNAWSSAKSAGTHKLRKRWVDSRCAAISFRILRWSTVCFSAVALSNVSGLYYEELWERKIFALAKTIIGILGMRAAVSLHPKVTDAYVLAFAAVYTVCLGYPIIYSAVAFGFHVDFVRSWCGLAGMDCTEMSVRSARYNMSLFALCSMIYQIVGFILSFQFSVFARIFQAPVDGRRESGYTLFEQPGIRLWNMMQDSEFESHSDGAHLRRVNKNNIVDVVPPTAHFRDLPARSRSDRSISDAVAHLKPMCSFGTPWQVAKRALFLKCRTQRSRAQTAPHEFV